MYEFSEHGTISPAVIHPARDRSGSRRQRSPLGLLLGLLAAFAIALSADARTPAGAEPSTGRIAVANQTGYGVDLLLYDAADSSYTPFRHLPAGENLSESVKPGQTWFFRVNGEAFIGQYTTTDAADQHVVLDAGTLQAVGYPLPQERSGESASGVVGTKKPAPLPDVPFEAPPEKVAEQAALPPPADKAAAETTEPTRELRDWFEGPDDAIALVTHDAKLIDVSADGRFTAIKSTQENTAQTTAVWFAKEIPGTETYLLGNVHFFGRYVYIDQNAQDGWAPRLGAEAKDLPTGRWRLEKGSYFHAIVNDARPDLRLAVRNDRLVLSSKTYAEADAGVRDTVAHRDGGAFALFTVKSFRQLMSLKDGFVKMAQNIEELERKEAERLAQIERDKQEAAAAEARRRQIARVPQIAGGGMGHDQIAMRVGVGDVYTNAHGSKQIDYSYRPPGVFQPYLHADIYNSAASIEKRTPDQTAVLTLEPQISAWVHEGKLYVRVHTPDTTRIQMRHGKQPSTALPTDGNWYVSQVKMNLHFPYGREMHWFPKAESERTDAGVSQDSSEGVNFSFEEVVGADLSRSRGSNVNFGVMDYRVSGQRGPADDDFFGSVEYDWQGCGLAVTVKTTTNCTYTAPTDMYDPATQSLREIKKYAHALQGLETDTVFRVDYPSKQGLPDRLDLRLVVSTQFHMAKIVRSTEQNTENKGWHDFVAGFTYVWRPDKWDFDKSFEDQEIIREALYKPVGFTTDKQFQYWFFVHIEDLKPFMD